MRENDFLKKCVNIDAHHNNYWQSGDEEKIRGAFGDEIQYVATWFYNERGPAHFEVFTLSEWDFCAMVHNDRLYNRMRGREYGITEHLDKLYSEPGIILDEFVEQKMILDQEEKKYLSAVIKPFRKKIRCISKVESFGKNPKEYIFIAIKKDDIAMLPKFEKGTMYKGMETDKEYTLEELGL